MNVKDNYYDVVIAGQGAAAFAAGLYAARYQIKSLIIGETFGGETATGGLIENYPGYPEIDGFDLMLKFKEQVEKYDVPIIDDKVDSVKKQENLFQVKTFGGEMFSAGTVILAVGRNRRTLNLKNEEEWVGRGVSYCSTCDAPMHKNNVVAIVGGGNAAVEGALLLSRYASTVYLIYRKEEFTRPEPISLQQLNQSKNIKQVMSTNVTQLNGVDGLDSISIDKEYNGVSEIDVDGIFIEIGADPRVEIPNQLKLELNEKNEVIVDSEMRTNVEGIFAAGDLCNSSGDLKQTITAASQGAIAATSTYHYIMNSKLD
ncbi:MAG: FAD-dependent oxidoreductase [SAR202 cluster bacterium]|nr:FAD-dependent oxidoreductase [SAR202 cluster bacterium]